jgi:hypothetical protein
MVSTNVYAPPPEPEVDIEKSTNGFDADSAPGPTIPVGETVNWLYRVTNTGNVILQQVDVTDSESGGTWTIYNLSVGEMRAIQAAGTATAGQYENTGRAEGTAPDGRVVVDEDLSHYFGGEPGGEPSVPMLPAAAIPVALAAVGIYGVRRRKT